MKRNCRRRKCCNNHQNKQKRKIVRRKRDWGEKNLQIIKKTVFQRKSKKGKTRRMYEDRGTKTATESHGNVDRNDGVGGRGDGKNMNFLRKMVSEVS